jgi:hypothetical protein
LLTKVDESKKNTLCGTFIVFNMICIRELYPYRVKIMGLKHLLVILSCSAVSVSLCVPSRAENILQNSNLNLESTDIKNKGYGNKQTKQSLVGIWKTVVNQQSDPVVNYVNFKPNGTYNEIFKSRNGTQSLRGVWSYSNGLYTQWNTNGRYAKAAITWVSNDEVLFTIIDNGNPHHKGAQITYYREQQPVSNSPSGYRNNQEQLRNYYLGGYQNDWYQQNQWGDIHQYIHEHF